MTERQTYLNLHFGIKTTKELSFEILDAIERNDLMTLANYPETYLYLFRRYTKKQLSIPLLEACTLESLVMNGVPAEIVHGILTENPEILLRYTITELIPFWCTRIVAILHSHHSKSILTAVCLLSKNTYTLDYLLEELGWSVDYIIDIQKTISYYLDDSINLRN